MMYVVTGGSGFIGSHVVDKLRESGQQVRVFDKVAPAREDVEWLEGDITIYDDVLQACQDADIVYHLAAIADVNAAITDPELCLTVNELGTLRLMRAARAREVHRVVLASTTWVYGESNEPVHEDMKLPPPDHPYTKTKLGQEHIVRTFGGRDGVPYTILRYDIPYGPRMRSNMAIATFVNRASTKQPISVYGDGEQGRCWVFIDDLVSGTLAASDPNGENQVINIAGDAFITVNQVVGFLKERFGEILIRRQAERPGDFRGVVTRIDKARRLLGWFPKTAFGDGINKYIDWVVQQRK